MATTSDAHAAAEILRPEHFENIPRDLRQLAQWVCWRIVLRKGKATKMPMQPGGAPASSTDFKTWSTFERVCNSNGQFDGIGFVFTKEAGFVGIDLDKCRNPETGETEKWALAIIGELDSYTLNLSQSGTGCHVIVKRKPATGRQIPAGSRGDV